MTFPLNPPFSLLSLLFSPSSLPLLSLSLSLTAVSNEIFCESGGFHKNHSQKFYLAKYCHTKLEISLATKLSPSTVCCMAMCTYAVECYIPLLYAGEKG